MKKKWLVCQPGKVLLIVGMVLGMWTGYPDQGGVASAGQPQTVVFSDPIILLEVENSSGQELPLNQYGLGRLGINLQSGIAYHDFGSNADDRVRIYADNGAMRFGSPADSHNTVNLDMTWLECIYAMQSNTGMYVYVVMGYAGEGTEQTRKIAVIGKSKDGRFTAYTNDDTWRKFYPADQDVVDAYYAERKKIFTNVSKIEPHSPVSAGHCPYTVSVQQDTIAIVGTIRSTFSRNTPILSQWQYLLKWNGAAGNFDISYQRLQ